MVAKKTAGKPKSRKLTFKRETLKDLNVGKKDVAIKGGSLVNCQTRKTQ